MAEVLITLGIMGIVSVLTIPNIISNYQKNIAINKLKSEYSKFANLITHSVNNNGDISHWISEFDNISDLSEKSKLITEKYIIPYIDGGGKPFKQYSYGNVWSLGGKEAFFAYYNSGIPYRIKNGTVFKISIYNNNIILLLDIDNKIKNNRVGKDVFAFIINPKNNRLEPAGKGLSRNVLTGIDKDRWCMPSECGTTEWLAGWQACNRNNSNRYGGYFCSALIIQDGWQMKDDYPW